ncbi:SDR family NAD(P)-dependent oxidoreductase [Streptomyces sp. ICN988]|uniref:SDR family NAD(P)-dependent oxidoreductase n=1 Tax=Streptomyces sp. ICN988 TaxID=2983765 RepID=UPI0021E37CFC|nr:SDR family NAD(P)-dependent oxidoreductase [Streptomyces sp. ICN988]MCV2458170.1 SDR family NAD(P)-dependent oxidoreductase [Streptomyces sp. ICN988]
MTRGTVGVGRAAVREFAAQGYDVAVLARGQAGLDGAVSDAEGAGGRALGIPTDVADHAAVRQAAERVEQELGEILVGVNVAFTGSLAFFWDTSPEEYERMTQVTYLGQVNGTRAALEHMRPRDRGVVVNVGSAMAYRSIPLQSAYRGAKHAVKGFTETLMTELIHAVAAPTRPRRYRDIHNTGSRVCAVPSKEPRVPRSACASDGWCRFFPAGASVSVCWLCTPLRPR